MGITYESSGNDGNKPVKPKQEAVRKASVPCRKKPVKAGSGKGKKVGPIVGISVAAVGVIGLVWLGLWTYFGNKDAGAYGFKTPEELAQKVCDLTIVHDIEGVFNLQQEDFQARSDSDIRLTYQRAADDRQYTLQHYKEVFDDTSNIWHFYEERYGQRTKMSAETGTYEPYSEDGKDTYERMCLTQCVNDEFICDEVGVVPVTFHFEGESYDEPLSLDAKVPVVKIKGKWYLGQAIGEAYAKLVDPALTCPPWYDMLDGFHVLGEFDENRQRIWRQDAGSDVIPEGTQILKTEDGKKWYYEDEYRNHAFCTVEVTNKLYGRMMATPTGEKEGPFGGEVLTEDTYEEWWNNYYEEEQRKWEEENPEEAAALAAEEEAMHEHDHDDSEFFEEDPESVSGDDVEIIEGVLSEDAASE